MAFITVAGENQIAAKQGAGQTLNIVSFVLANIDGLGPEPVNRIEAMPAAGDIMATLPVTQSGYVNTNQVVYSLVMDSSLGDYDFNWVGLVDDAGVLIAVVYTPLIQKRKTTGAVPGNNLTRNFLIAFSGIQATTAIAVPAETWQIDFNARLWGIDERERLSNYDIYGHEGFFGDGWKVVRDGATTTYNVQPGVGYVGGGRIASAVIQPVTVASPPASIWVDVSLQGDISDVSPVVDFIIDAVAHNDYTDTNGFKHYVTKIADIAANGSVSDLRAPADFSIVSGRLLRTSIYINDAGTLKVSIDGGAFVPASSTFTALAETKSVDVEVQAGGASGGGAAITNGTQVSAGAGGGGGGYARKRINSGFSGVTITVGAGGVGSTGTGQNGGSSSFGSIVSSTGGEGGSQGAAQSISGQLTGHGVGGIGTGGDINSSGGNGLYAVYNAAAISGYGGSSMFGGGAVSASTNLNGGNSESYGAGGSGAANGVSQAVARSGGHGKGGVVIVREKS